MKKHLFPVLLLLIIFLGIFLRGFRLLSSPPSLYWEEAAIGYDAYSILKTGRDHHGNFMPFLAFESFGDWKPGLYFYPVAFSELFLGLTPLAVRLPALLAGIMLFIGTAVLTQKLLIYYRVKQQDSKWQALAVLFIAATSSWAIMFSRAGWESMLASALIIWAVVFWYFQTKLQFKYILISVLLFSLSAYTYHAARLIAPLILLFLFVQHLIYLLGSSQINTKLLIKLKPLIVSGIIFTLLISPILFSIRNTQVSNRFTTSSIFADGKYVQMSNQLRELSNNSLLSKLFFHRYVTGSYLVAVNYWQHFNLNYLFISGDSNLRHSVGYYGQLYYLDAILIAFGLIWWWQNSKKGLSAILIMMAICILPSSLSTGAPHSLRTLSSQPFYAILIGSGLYYVLISIKSKVNSKLFVLLTLATLCIYTFQVMAWFGYDQTIYPKIAAKDWQYGYFELYKSLNKIEKDYPALKIYVSREQGRPSMYYFFFNQIDPQIIQKQDKTLPKDMSEIVQFNQYYFFDKVEQINQPAIVALSPTLSQQISNFKLLKEIKSLDGSVVWNIGIYE